LTRKKSGYAEERRKRNAQAVQKGSKEGPRGSFGSRCPFRFAIARDADPDSDFDLLVTVQNLQEMDRKRVFEIAADLSLEYDTVLAVLVVPANDFTEDRYFYLYENIQKEGQVV
jgi:predicted nucleotidyltransferase